MNPSADQKAPLRLRLHALSVRDARLQGIRDVEAARAQELHANVSQAKARAALAPEISQIFDKLQQRAVERSVGGFERVLTAILNDVVPGQGRVRLLPEFKDNTTWLDVALEKDGNLEDILDGNGGAVTNVVSVGLRYAALTRTSNRRILTLDEPDCWVQDSRVESLAQVIAQVSEQTKTQTLLITHHAPSYFEGTSNIVELVQDVDEDGVAQGPISARVKYPLVRDWPSDEEPGLRAIELINFRTYEHTRIPCFPGSTVYIGRNNLGKSAGLNASIRAVAYGGFVEDMLRHGCDNGSVILHLEKGLSVECTRSRKASPAVVYRLHQRGQTEPVRESRQDTRNRAPDWVVELLGIRKERDIDVQVGNQKSPVFLLDDTASRRAELLSIGRESSYLKDAMRRYESLRGADRETIKSGELELVKLSHRARVFKDLQGASELLAEVVVESYDLLHGQDNLSRLSELCEGLTKAGDALSRLEQEWAALKDLPSQAPALADVDSIRKTADRLGQLEVLEKLSAPELPAAPVLRDTGRIAELGVRLAQGLKTEALLALVPESLPQAPVLAQTDALKAATETLQRAIMTIQTAETDFSTASKDVSMAETQVRELKETLKVCPLCDTPFDVANSHHHHHA